MERLRHLGVPVSGAASTGHQLSVVLPKSEAGTHSLAEKGDQTGTFLWLMVCELGPRRPLRPLIIRLDSVSYNFQEMIESPGAQLVLEVARQAQVVLEYVADVLEKIKK